MNKSLIILLVENLILLITGIIYLCRKWIFFCPKCQQRKKKILEIGLGIICSDCKRKEQKQCRVF